MGGLEPLRASLAELALNDPALREQLRASLAAADGQLAGGRQAAAFGDLLGLRDEDAQLNMASPVLPTRHGSCCGTPGSEADGCYEEEDWEQEEEQAARENSMAKRNLMDVLQSREAEAGQQQRGGGSGGGGRQQVQYVHPQRSLQHAARHQRQQQQQHEQHHLQPWQRQGNSRPGSAGPQQAAHTTHTRVSLAQLMAAPAAGGRPSSAAVGGSRGGHGAQPHTLRQNSGAKRGREEVPGASRAPSGKSV